MTILIRNGRIIDPANERDEVGDLLLSMDGSRNNQKFAISNQQLMRSMQPV
jgi:hypothetical protein